MDKRKRFKLTLEIFKDIMKICPRVQGQDFDALPTDEEIVSFLRELRHTREINSLNDVVVDHMHQTWRTFVALINKKATQIYGVILPESLTSSEMKETKAYQAYLGFATGATPPNKVRKFKKPPSPQLTTILVSSEEPIKKLKRVKRPAKKPTKAPTGGVVIRETLKMPLSKKKEKVDVSKGKEIELLSEVALTEEAQYEAVRRKSMRDCHKTHPSGSGTVTKTAPSAAKIKPSGNNIDDSNNEQDSRSKSSDEENDSKDKNTQSDSEKGSDSEHETNENQLDSEFDQEENEDEIGDDEEEKEEEFVRTPSNNSDDETKIYDKVEGDEDEEMDYTTSQLYDDVDIRLNKPEISQVLKDAHVTLSSVPWKTEVPVTSSSHSSDLASKFLNFSDIPHTDVEIVSLTDVHIHHEAVLAKESSQPQSSYEAAATLIEFDLKKILIDKMDISKLNLAAPKHRECYEGLIKSYDLDKTIFSTYDKVYSLKRSQKNKERFSTTAGNPFKEILLKLNLPDHRSILTDLKVTPTKHERMTKPYSSYRFIANCFISGIYKNGRGDLGLQLMRGDGGYEGVWRGKWGPLVAKSKEGSGWVEETNFVSDYQGTKSDDSRNELSLQTFYVINEIDGSGGEDGVVLMFLGLPSSFRPSSFNLSSRDLFGCLEHIVIVLIESWVQLTTGQLINGSSYGGFDMVIKDLDLEQKIDAMMRDYLDPSQWKELSKETSIKILPCGDGSC
nr:hypothetical protein [Tanacetum cinerariifolium]